MQQIHELLNRIHWDEEFGKGNFELGFLDHVEEKIIRLPFHRIKTVYKNGELIWHREH
jgi:uncharacterized protein (UPF0248 family)